MQRCVAPFDKAYRTTETNRQDAKFAEELIELKLLSLAFFASWRSNFIMSDISTSIFVTVAKVGEIPEGEGRSFQVGERLVAVFHQNGNYFAIDDLCPHMGASLGAGYLDEEGIVTCPWHAWRFCVQDGKWADNPRLGVDKFEVRVEGDEIQVRV